MTYRERPLSCPRCSVELVGYPSREKWRCRSCAGVLAGPEELPVELAVLDDVRDRKRRATASIGCPACGTTMQQMRVLKLDIDIERCTRDGYVWFDAGELGALRAFVAEEI